MKFPVNIFQTKTYKQFFFMPEECASHMFTVMKTENYTFKYKWFISYIFYVWGVQQFKKKANPNQDNKYAKPWKAGSSYLEKI